MNEKPWAIAFAVLLLSFTTYLALDTFVLSTAITENATEENLSLFSSLTDSTNSTSSTGGKTFSLHGSGTDSTDNTETTDDPYTITLNKYREYDTTIYVAEITLQTAQSLHTAFAEDTYGKNVTANTSQIAAAHNAVLAINGDYYGARESGYVIRNGVVYRSTSSGEDILCLFADGSMEIVDSSTITADELVANGCWQAWDFGPALIENGSVAVSEGDEVGRAMASNPRTAIGYVDPLHYFFVVSDGRTDESAGLSLYQLGQFMQSLGCVTAYNLDGGGSSTMYYNGAVVNNPTTSGDSIKERAVSDIVYLA